MLCVPPACFYQHRQSLAVIQYADITIVYFIIHVLRIQPVYYSRSSTMFRTYCWQLHTHKLCILHVPL